MIYCVEDDPGIRELIVYTLNHSGYEAKGFERGEELFPALKVCRPQLILLDVMLPGEDGISILKRIKAGGNSVPVIMVTAKSAEYDKVVGLDCGADDYITKPFGMMELLSRIRAVLRRCAPLKTRLSMGEVVLDNEAHTVTVKGKPVELTYKEFELLHCLMESPGKVFTRDMLLERIWGYDFGGETRTVDVHVRTLRQKLEGADIVKTVRGVGYSARLEEEKDEEKIST
ncbi:MAG TPA: response regulator transcription factor [Firmicutes bacterium]|nr:response regulator transcription factor [Bacillota bacterium]